MKTFKELFFEYNDYNDFKSQISEGVKIYSWKGGLTLDGGYRSWTADPNKAKHREFAEYEKEDPGYNIPKMSTQEKYTRMDSRKYTNTCENYLKRKPFKRFTMKQVEVILKAFSRNNTTVESLKNDISYLVYGHGNDKASYSGSKIVSSLVFKWNDVEGWLGVGFYFDKDFAFIKGDKVQTVYVEPDEIEKYFKRKLNYGIAKAFSVDNIVVAKADGRKNGRDYTDIVMIRIANVDGYSIQGEVYKKIVLGAGNIRIDANGNPLETGRISYDGSISGKIALDVDPKLEVFRDTDYLDLSKALSNKNISDIKKYLDKNMSINKLTTILAKRIPREFEFVGYKDELK